MDELKKINHSNHPKKYILKIHCPDKKGLIYRITEYLYQQNLNIIHNSEYVDPQTQHFFMRTEIEGKINAKYLKKNLFNLLSEKFGPELELEIIPAAHKKRVIILVTKEPHCIGDLLIRCIYGELNVEIMAVISNHIVLKSLVSSFGIPFYDIDHQGHTRETHENLLISCIENQKFSPDYIVLAKYMRILTPQFTEKFKHKILNIHHSFLPAFIGAAPYRQAYDRGVKIVGATAHFVNDQLDEGPIIVQNVMPVSHVHNANDMALAGKDVEKVTLAAALRQLVEDRVFIHGKKTIIF